MTSDELETNAIKRARERGDVVVACRNCGTEWIYPKRYKNMFDADCPLELCSYCLGLKKYGGKEKC